MDLNNLSSNWKKLQATLQNNTSKSSKSSKRRASHDLSQPHINESKRRKRTLKPSTAVSENKENNSTHGRMGVRSSKVEANDPKQAALSSSKEMLPSAALALWADDNDISREDLIAAYGGSLKDFKIPDVVDNINEGLSVTAKGGKYIAIDCEMVGVGPNAGRDSALARISIVNYHGQQLYDSFVMPKEAVTDYRTFVSGITPELLQSARTLEAVQTDVAKLLDGKVLIGHAIRNDLNALLLGHPKRDIRDTSSYPGFRQLAGGKTPALKKLAKEVLGIDIQNNEHSSIEDARATMLLFRREKEGFKREHSKIWGAEKKVPNGATVSNIKSSGKKKRKTKTKK